MRAAGATLVAGHSAHVFHGVADRVIYDLGDFIDDYATDPALRNDLGLLSEEYDVQSKRLVGNFPQAFSHIALVNAAFDLADGEKMRARCHRHMGPKPADKHN